MKKEAKKWNNKAAEQGHKEASGLTTVLENIVDVCKNILVDLERMRPEYMAIAATVKALEAGAPLSRLMQITEKNPQEKKEEINPLPKQGDKNEKEGNFQEEKEAKLNKHYEESITFYHRGEYDKAIENCNQMLALDSQNVGL